MSETKIRLGTSADHEQAVRVWLESNTARRGGVQPPAAHIERVRGHLTTDGAFLIVAEDSGEIVGMAVGLQGLEDDGAGPPIPGLCHISMVFVSPDRWGRGIGKQVVTQVMKEARDRGFRRAQLWTHMDNERAASLYEGLGFVRSGRIKPDDENRRMMHFVRDL